MQNSDYAKHDIMMVINAIFGRITLGPPVDQLATSTLALADSAVTMQLCRHDWEVKNLQQCA